MRGWFLVTVGGEWGGKRENGKNQIMNHIWAHPVKVKNSDEFLSLVFWGFLANFCSNFNKINKIYWKIIKK